MNFGGFVGRLEWSWPGQGLHHHGLPTINAGLDMAMASDSWKGYETTLAAVKDGRITPQRLDDAVRRILRVKFRLGLFEAGRPSAPLAASSAIGAHIARWPGRPCANRWSC